MRGHICDMDRLSSLCRDHGITLIEDCAYTMGAAWNGRATGTWGQAGFFSLQSYKHTNAGEGGLLVTNDPDVAAQAILYSGSWWLAENPCFKKIRLLNFKHPAFSHCPVPVDRSNRAIAFARDTNLQIRDERHPGFAPIWKIFVLQNQPAPIGGTEFSVKHEIAISVPRAA